jgi:hypothetical protein
MPAVTADTVALPRLPSLTPDAVQRPVVSVTTAPSGFEGEGFPVRRAFAGVDLAPFVHMDQMGDVDYAPGEPKGTPWHLHRGFETVTYMIDGIFQHQDSNGGGGLITDGDTQWMTAGGSIPQGGHNTAPGTGAAHYHHPWPHNPSVRVPGEGPYTPLPPISCISLNHPHNDLLTLM